MIPVGHAAREGALGRFDLLAQRFDAGLCAHRADAEQQSNGDPAAA
jgi:hypothetical protein